jgi:hypothetical protein
VFGPLSVSVFIFVFQINFPFQGQSHFIFMFMRFRIIMLLYAKTKNPRSRLMLTLFGVRLCQFIQIKPNSNTVKTMKQVFGSYCASNGVFLNFRNNFGRLDNLSIPMVCAWFQPLLVLIRQYGTFHNFKLVLWFIDFLNFKSMLEKIGLNKSGLISSDHKSSLKGQFHHRTT